MKCLFSIVSVFKLSFCVVALSSLSSKLPTASSNFGCPRNLFSSSYFQIGQHLVLLHILMVCLLLAWNEWLYCFPRWSGKEKMNAWWWTWAALYMIGEMKDLRWFNVSAGFPSIPVKNAAYLIEKQLQADSSFEFYDWAVISLGDSKTFCL